jgi:hypothetical protein
MGLIRKTISGTAAVMTGGLSLGVVQYRSDTERGTRQTKLLRKEQQAGNGHLARLAASQASAAPMISPQETSDGTAERLERLQRLHELKVAGVLTDAEFQAQKRALLG